MFGKKPGTEIALILSYVGLALRARRSKALPLTASYLSPLPGFKSWSRHVRKLPVNLGKVVVFASYSSFLYQFKLVVL